MSNDISLTGLTEIVYAARDQVAAEPTGFAQGVMINSNVEGVSINGTITSMRTAVPTIGTSYTPAMTVSAASDLTTTTDSMTLSQVATADIPLKGETMKQLMNTAGAQGLQNLIAQAIRGLRNTIEARIGVVAKNGASRAIGTAGTTPFASNVNTIAQLRQILLDNGCPMDDGMLSLIINSSAGTNLRNVSNLYKVNEAGSDATLRRGELLNLHGFSIRETAGIATHTAGSGASYLANGAAAIGDRALTVDTGSGTILAGDVITYAADSTNKYVVGSALASNVVTLNYPGIKVALPDNNAITVGAGYTGNIGFHRSAIELGMRPPAMPDGGDSGFHDTLYDDKTGLVFDMGLYKGMGMNMLKFVVFYEAKVWKPEFVATLLG